jgi:hypothetical protein
MSVTDEWLITVELLLESRVQILLGAWRFVYSECCLLSSRGLCVGLFTQPEESCRVWCVWVWSRCPLRGGGGCKTQNGSETPQGGRINKYGALVERYWQEKIETLGKETCLVTILFHTNPPPLCWRFGAYYTIRNVSVPSPFRQNGLCSHCPSCSVTFQNSTWQEPAIISI